MKDDPRSADHASGKARSSFILPPSSLFLHPSAFILQPCPPRPVARELPRDAPAARAARERPLQRRSLGLFRARAGGPEVLQPDPDDPQVVVLVEGVERHPQAEALGERD